MNLFWGKKSTRKNNKIATRKLRLESLENRELLDASGIIYVNTNIDHAVAYNTPLSDFTILENGSPDYNGDGYTSLREALVYCKAKSQADNEVTNTQIVFEPSDAGFTGGDSNTIRLSAGGLATSDLLYGIDGSTIEGGVTIDGAGQYMGLNLTASFGAFEGYNNIKSIHFTNCAYASSLQGATFGGAVRVATSATFTDCTFTNCWSGSNAGALLVMSGDVVLNNCTFDNCYSTAQTGGYGGAIAVVSSTNTKASSLTVFNSSFTNCHAPNGGAIAVQANGSYSGVTYPTQLTVVDSVFENNYSNTILGSSIAVQAGQGGGAIWSAGTTLIKGQTHFMHNSSNTNGGAICVEQGFLTIAGTNDDPIEFNNNQVYESNYNIETGETIDRTQTALDAAAKTSGGGAISIAKLSGENRYYDADGQPVYAPVAHEVVFHQNSSATNGGTINVAYTSTYDVVLEDATIRFSSANRFGGGIFNAGKVSLVGDSSVHQSYALLGGAYYGYGTFTAGSDAASNANDAGVVAFVDNFAYADDNGKYGSGGAIYNTSTKAYTGVVTLNGVQFDYNNSLKYGGAIANFGLLEVTNAIFDGNYSEECYGGAIQTAGTAYVSDSVFSNNEGYNGGAIYVSNNKTTGAEGVLYLGGELLFEDNVAAHAGGAICLSSGTLSFAGTEDFDAATDVTFEFNSAKLVGGALAIGGTVAFPENDAAFTFTDNDAEFGPTVAASGYTYGTVADALKAGFGFSKDATSDEFAAFVRTVSSGTMELTYEYLKQLLDVAHENASVFYKIGEDGTYQELAKGETIDVSERATIYYYAVDANGKKSLVCRLLADPKAGSSLAVHSALTEEMLAANPDLAGISFRAYGDKPVKEWTIDWGDGNVSTHNALGYSWTEFHQYAELGVEYKIALSVKYADGSAQDFGVVSIFSRQEAASALVDALFADAELLNDLFVG